MDDNSIQELFDGIGRGAFFVVKWTVLGIALAFGLTMGLKLSLMV